MHPRPSIYVESMFNLSSMYHKKVIHKSIPYKIMLVVAYNNRVFVNVMGLCA